MDKLEKLKSELNEVEKIVHKNMDDLLKRDEDLNKLMEKSQDVSKMSLDFYKNAKKANKRCCSLYWFYSFIKLNYTFFRAILYIFDYRHIIIVYNNYLNKCCVLNVKVDHLCRRTDRKNVKQKDAHSFNFTSFLTITKIDNLKDKKVHKIDSIQ